MGLKLKAGYSIYNPDTFEVSNCTVKGGEIF